jgi:hypothetical protein
MNHSPNRRSIWENEGLIESSKPKALDDLALIFGSSDHAPSPLDRDPLLLAAPLSFPWFFHASSPKPPLDFSVGRWHGG